MKSARFVKFTYSSRLNRGFAGEDLNTATYMPFLSKYSDTSPILVNCPIGTKYSSVSTKMSKE